MKRKTKKPRVDMIGVSAAVPLREIEHMSGTQQDAYAKLILEKLIGELRNFTGDTRPITGGFYTAVKGPISDPLLGMIWVHTASAKYDLDALPLGCPARVADTTGRPYEPKSTDAHTPDTDAAAARYTDGYLTTRPTGPGSALGPTVAPQDVTPGFASAARDNMRVLKETDAVAPVDADGLPVPGARPDNAEWWAGRVRAPGCQHYMSVQERDCGFTTCERCSPTGKRVAR